MCRELRLYGLTLYPPRGFERAPGPPRGAFRPPSCLAPSVLAHLCVFCRDEGSLARAALFEDAARTIGTALIELTMVHRRSVAVAAVHLPGRQDV